MKRISKATLSVVVLASLSFSVFAQSESRDDLLKKIETSRAELALLEKQILEPSEQDKMAYAEFLLQPDTGLMRLLPREKYDDQAYKGKTHPSVTIRGGGAYYSFTSRSHDYNSGSPQISLEMKELSVGFAGGDYGLMTSLGDVPIDQITIEHQAAQFMADYKAPTDQSKAGLEVRRFYGHGVTLGGARYTRSVPAKVDTTYLLRSVSFVTSDVLVAFRIVRQDTDGSMIVAWKLLKKYPNSKLARSNN